MIRLLIASGAMIALLGWTVVAKTGEERRLRETIAGHVACQSGIEGGTTTLGVCSEKVTAVVHAARRAAACDAVLAGGQPYLVSSACSTEVQALAVQRDARTREVANLTETLDRLRRDQAAAITRAEARGRTQTQRTQRAEDALAQAPVNDSGLGRCDADCLRNLGRD